jgi:hypothetical protein
MFYWKFNSKKTRWALWYNIAIIVMLMFIILWYIMWSYLLSIVIFIFAWVYLLLDNNFPDIIDININESGIKIWTNLYDYPKIESFSIIYNNNIPILLQLNMKVFWFKNINIPLNNQEIDVVALKNFLLQFLAENQKWELWFIDKLTNYLKL